MFRSRHLEIARFAVATELPHVDKSNMAAEKHLLTHPVQYLKLNKCFIHFEDVSQSL